MKKIFTLVFVLLSTQIARGQYFEGKITYHTTFKSTTPKISNEKLSTVMGNKQEYYIKGGNYKSVTNGTFAQWQLFINKDNKIYNKMSNSETLMWNDAAVYGDSVFKIQLIKDAEVVLGYKCDELILTCSAGTQKYFFNKKIAVNTKLYERHKYSNWYAFLKQSNALPLKMVITDKQFTMESVATEVLPMKLADKEFQLPENAKTERSPF